MQARADVILSHAVLIGVLFVFCAVPGAFGQSAAEQTIGEACSGDAFRQFDFWLGTWVVRDSTGAEVGRSHVSRQADGCALLEQWYGQNGVTGTSLNYFDAADGNWHQRWVGGGGLILHLVGTKRSDEMVLRGTRATPEGEVLDAIAWKPLGNGRVRQEWRVSSDGGASWETVFLGLYEKE